MSDPTSLFPEWVRRDIEAVMNKPSVLSAAAVERIIAARTAPETVALDVEAVARALSDADVSEPFTDEEWDAIGSPEKSPRLYRAAHAVVAADPRRTVAEVKAEALAPITQLVEGWLHDGPEDGAVRLLLIRIQAMLPEADRIERDAATSEGVEG